MEKKFLEIRKFVQSLENGELNKKQEAVLLVGENALGLGNGDYDNDKQCKGSDNSNCRNRECPMSTNRGTCMNTDDCVYSSNNSSCTGGGSGSGNTGGTKGIGGSLLGFPGFDL